MTQTLTMPHTVDEVHFLAEFSLMCSARDLISKLLTTDAARRLTAAQALDHPWIKNASKAHKGTLTLTRRNLAKHVGARVKVT